MKKNFKCFAIVIFASILSSCSNLDSSNDSFSEIGQSEPNISETISESSEPELSESESNEDSMKHIWESNSLLSIIPYPDFGNVIKIDTEMENVAVGNIISSVGAVVSNTNSDDFYNYFSIVKGVGFVGTNNFTANVYNAVLTKGNYYLVFSQSGNLLTLTIQERI